MIINPKKKFNNGEIKTFIIVIIIFFLFRFIEPAVNTITVDDDASQQSLRIE